MICNRCESEFNSNYCPNCGSPAQNAAVRPMIRCRKCGTEFNTAFCPQCGSPALTAFKEVEIKPTPTSIIIGLFLAAIGILLFLFGTKGF